MANFRDDFFAALDAGNRWSVPVAINRNNPLPLDDNSVFRTEAELDAYIAGPLVYPGQVVALVEANKTTIYYIDHEGAKQEVGANLSADGKTVVINNGNITLANMPTDTTKTYNATLVNGVLTWTEPSATTVEGLDTRLTAAEGQINTLNQQVAELGKAFEFKGTASSVSADGKTIYNADGQAIEDVAIGDVYQIGDKEYAYNGTVWVELGFNVDLSGYVTDEELDVTDQKAEQAQVSADAAQLIADEGKTAAGNAQTAAEGAQATANQAVQDAAAASTKAQTGIDNAATAQAKAEEAFNKATTNTTEIESIRNDLTTEQGKITNLQNTVGEHTRKITNLETFQTEHTALYEALSSTVTTHGTDIAGLKTGKADTTVTDALDSRVTANENAIKAFNETTIPGINEEIGKKANSDAVYTKEQVNAITGTPTEGKTLVAMIADAQAAATYDDTAIKALIQGNTDAITNITKEDGLIATAKAEALKATEDLAKGAVKDNTDAIAKLNGEAGAEGSVATIADARIAAALAGADEDFDTLKEMSDWLSTHADTAATMNSAITDNANAIKTINETTIPNAITTANSYTDTTIATLKLAETYEAKGTAEALLVAYKIKDVDNTTLQVNESGIASVKAVSTDLLTQGNEELIFNAGNAGTISAN